MTPGQILKQSPGPWRQETYTDGTIRVFDAFGREVGLLDVLGVAIGMANAAAAHRAEKEAQAQATPA